MVGNRRLHYDNARSHDATSVHLSKCSIKIMPHPPYSPDPAPCYFWLFPIATKKLHGRKVIRGSEVIFISAGFFEAASKKWFSTCFEKPIERWD